MERELLGLIGAASEAIGATPKLRAGHHPISWRGVEVLAFAGLLEETEFLYTWPFWDGISVMITRPTFQ